MISRALFLLAVPVVLALAACGSTDPAPSPISAALTPSPTPTQTATVTPIPVAQPQDVDPNAYRLDGEGAIGSTDDVWWGDFAFYTDASKTVWCDINEGSESPGRVICEVIVGHESQVTYAVPPPVSDQCDSSSTTYRDSYAVGLGLFQSIGTDSGFFSCRELQTDHPDWIANSLVLPDLATITVEEFSCSVSAGIVTCGRPGGSGSIQFGLSVANFSN